MSEPGPVLEGPGPHADAAAWVLGALDPLEAERFAVHLESCEACRQEVRELRPARALLGVAAPPVELPPGLEERTLRAVRAAAVEQPVRRPVAQPGAAVVDLAERRRRPRPPLTWLVAAAAAVLVAVGGGIWVQRQNAPAPATVTIALRAPNGGAARGEAVGENTDNGWSVRLTVSGLPPIPDDKGHYECWYVGTDDSASHPDAVSAGSFEIPPGGTSADVRMWTVWDLQANPGSHMIVTLEPDNDPARTGPVVLSGVVPA